jgi:hypothetical protein
VGVNRAGCRVYINTGSPLVQSGYMPRADSSSQQRPLTGDESRSSDEPVFAAPWSRAEVTAAAAGAAGVEGTMALEDSQSDQVVPLNTAEDPEARLHWTALPPMPTPHTGVMRSQACGGITLVLFIIAMCVAGTHFFTSRVEGTFPVALNVAVWAEAVVAVLCLLGLMYGNPGEIKRSEATCTVRLATPLLPRTSRCICVSAT